MVLDSCIAKFPSRPHYAQRNVGLSSGYRNHSSFLWPGQSCGNKYRAVSLIRRKETETACPTHAHALQKSGELMRCHRSSCSAPERRGLTRTDPVRLPPSWATALPTSRTSVVGSSDEERLRIKTA